LEVLVVPARGSGINLELAGGGIDLELAGGIKC
jgi:hypothetical protein